MGPAREVLCVTLLEMAPFKLKLTKINGRIAISRVFIFLNGGVKRKRRTHDGGFGANSTGQRSD
jgi:hypothetical protein